MIDAWYYFGCGKDAGHYVFAEGAKRIDYRVQDALARFDGRLAPQPEGEPYLVAWSRLGGWKATALSWWDRSTDKRPGSNSIIFAPSLTIDPVETLVEANRRFPWVFSRLPRPLKWTPQ